MENQPKLKIIITGTTGMVGEGVLHECLLHPDVEEVLSVSRKPCGVKHPKLKEELVQDFFNLGLLENRLSGYNACLFCLGVSSVGMKEPEYFHLTYELTMNFARTVSKQNPQLTFCYISGAGTDSTEKGRSMWARVKGKTENDLRKLPFKNVYNFRPAMITPTPGMKNTLGFYKWFGWLAPVIRTLSPNSISSLKQLGLAMINVCRTGYEKNTVEVSDIKKIAANKN